MPQSLAHGKGAGPLPATCSNLSSLVGAVVDALVDVPVKRGKSVTIRWTTIAWIDLKKSCTVRRTHIPKNQASRQPCAVVGILLMGGERIGMGGSLSPHMQPSVVLL